MCPLAAPPPLRLGSTTSRPGGRPAIHHAVIDPYQPYATAVSNELGDARLVVDTSTRSAWPTPPLTMSVAGSNKTPSAIGAAKANRLYRIRRRLLLAREKLSDDAFDRVLAWLERGDPDGEVSVAYLPRNCCATSETPTPSSMPAAASSSSTNSATKSTSTNSPGWPRPSAAG